MEGSPRLTVAPLPCTEPLGTEHRMPILKDGETGECRRCGERFSRHWWGFWPEGTDLPGMKAGEGYRSVEDQRQAEQDALDAGWERALTR